MVREPREPAGRRPQGSADSRVLSFKIRCNCEARRLQDSWQARKRANADVEDWKTRVTQVAENVPLFTSCYLREYYCNIFLSPHVYIESIYLRVSGSTSLLPQPQTFPLKQLTQVRLHLGLMPRCMSGHPACVIHVPDCFESSVRSTVGCGE